ncbi:potassium transporter 10-like [Ricinus communis]|uniref:potassium transporter 10-like n=1 Tax=Ricinus communis TaxID=3988 RepID=UPI00201B004A|nr:potassium transporter 10-like [Ricinus communis]
MASPNDEDPSSNKGRMWAVHQEFDQPMDNDAGRLKNRYDNKVSALVLLQLAFQSLGVVYGDLGTSPLYVFYNTFPDEIKDPEEVIGALSLIIYSLTLIPLLKYVLIVCRANDNGQGGTFALYSLLCRHANIKTIPNQDRTDEELTTYRHCTFYEKSVAAKTKKWLEKNAFRKNALLILVLVGSCMVIGDGILTPAISVLSAVKGIKMEHSEISDDLVVIIAVAILVILFSVQYHGIDKFSWLFAPIVFLWFLLIGGIGIFNICKYDRNALKAFSPLYIYWYLKKGRGGGWTSLGGVILSITGTEALFADLSHFSVSAIQIAFTVVVFPSLLLAYTGQAAYLMKNKENVLDAFYLSIPETIYWPVLVVATCAAVVASQATISATFSLIKQALAVDCFPRVKVVHTSKKLQGQIYIPDINWVLMILCIAVTVGFKNQIQIGNASGAAVIIVMLVTTFLMVLVMLLVWRCHWILVLIFTSLSIVVEGTYFVAVLFKINQGGWVPLVIAASFFIIMSLWQYGSAKRYEFEMQSKVSMAWILGLGPSLGLVRVPGIGLMYTELAHGVPHIFAHFITNLPAIHSVVIFVCVKHLPVYTVPEEERFLVKRIGPRDFHMFRCVARYGYKDLHKRDDEFENKLFETLFAFVRLDSMMDYCSDSDAYSSCDQEQIEQPKDGHTDEISSVGEPASGSPVEAKQMENDELTLLRNCRDAGVVHILGNTVVLARKSSVLYKKLAINYGYSFLRKLCRENSMILNVPHESLLNVGQVIYV